MLIKGEVASLNHRDSAFLRPNLDSSLNLGVDRGVLTKLFKICPFLNFVNISAALVFSMPRSRRLST